MALTPVSTVTGVVFVAMNGRTESRCVPSLSWHGARLASSQRERLQADSRGRTVAYAVVRPDSVVVFEDFGGLISLGVDTITFAQPNEETTTR